MAEQAGGVSALHSRTTDTFCAEGGKAENGWNGEDVWEVVAMMVREQASTRRGGRERDAEHRNKKKKITDERTGELCMVSIGIIISQLFLVMV